MAGEVNQEKSNRDLLKARFQPGSKPTDEDFEKVIDSFLNLKDDGVKVDEHTFDISERKVSMNAFDAESGFIKELDVAKTLDAKSLNINGKKVEQVWIKNNAQASFTGDIRVDGDIKVGTGASGIISSDGSAVFTSLDVGSLKLGDGKEELIIHWQEINDGVNGIKRTGPVQIDGSATTPLLQVSGAGTFHTLGIGGQVQSNEVLSITGEVSIQNPPGSSPDVLFKVGGAGQFNSLVLEPPVPESKVPSDSEQDTESATDDSSFLLEVKGKARFNSIETTGPVQIHGSATNPLIEVKGSGTFNTLGIGGQVQSNEVLSITGEVSIHKLPDSSSDMLFKVGGAGQFNSLGIGQPLQEEDVLSIKGKISVSQPAGHTGPLLAVDGEASFESIKLDGKPLSHPKWNFNSTNNLLEYLGSDGISVEEITIPGNLGKNEAVESIDTLLELLEADIDGFKLVDYIKQLQQTLIFLVNKIKGLEPE